MNYKLLCTLRKRNDIIFILFAFCLQITFVFTSPLSEIGINYISLWGGLIYIGIAWGTGFILMTISENYLDKKFRRINEN